MTVAAKGCNTDWATDLLAMEEARDFSILLKCGKIVLYYHRISLFVFEIKIAIDGGF